MCVGTTHRGQQAVDVDTLPLSIPPHSRHRLNHGQTENNAEFFTIDTEEHGRIFSFKGKMVAQRNKELTHKP